MKHFTRPAAECTPSNLTTFKRQVHALWRSCFFQGGLWLWRRQPCVILLGNHGAGKSQLIESLDEHMRPLTEGVHTTSSKHQPIWWHTHHQAWLECSVSSQAAAGTQQANQNTRGFQKMFRYLNRWRLWLPITSVVIAIDLSHLYTLSNPQQHQLITQLQSCLQTLQKMHPELPAHVVCTRADLICGFETYCSGLSDEAREKILGVHLLDHTGRAIDADQALASLIDSLNQHMLLRVHEEATLARRRNLQEFPKQMAVLRTTLVSLVRNLFQNATLPCHGIYFSSTEQKERPVDYLAKSAEQSFALNTQINTETLPAHQCYFSDGIRAQVLQNARAPSTSLKQHALRLLILLVLGQGSYTWYTHTRTYPAQHFSQSLVASSTTSVTHAAALPSNPTDLDLMTQKLSARMTDVLTTDMQSNPEALYHDLITYLALAGIIQQDARMTHQHALHITQPHALNTLQQKQYSQLLAAWLDQQRNLTIDTQLVQSCLHALHNMPPATVVHLAWQRTEAWRHQQTPHAAKANTQINPLYLSDNYLAMTEQSMPEAVALYQQLYQRYAPDVTLPGTAELIDQVHAQYDAAYKQYWHQYMANAMPPRAHNLVDALDHFATMTQTHPAWMQALQTVVNNTNKHRDSHFQEVIGTEFKDYAFYLDQKAHATWMHLDALKQQLHNLTQSPTPELAAFQWAKNIAMHDGKNSLFDDVSQSMRTAPKPIAQGIDQQLLFVWQQLLVQSHAHINAQWQQHVYHGYAQAIAGHFPFDPTSDVDASAEDFSNYFSQTGIINTFFENYIQPFAQQDGRYWTWKTLYGQSLPISQDHLEFFVRSKLITEMFFDTTQPNRDAFALTLKTMPDNFNKITIKTGDQQATYMEGALPATTFHWPTSPYLTTVDITDEDHRHITQTRQGYWSLFHLLQDAHAAYDPNSGNIDLTLGTNGNNAHLLLSASQTIHPFIPHILDQMTIEAEL